MKKFAHINYHNIEYMSHRIKAREDGKAHITHFGGWWWCTVGIKNVDGSIGFGETPQLAYQMAKELQEIKNGSNGYYNWVDPTGNNTSRS